MSTREDDKINIQVNGITVDATGISENALYGGYMFELIFDDSSGNWSYTLKDADGDQISSNHGTTTERFNGNQYIFLSNQSLNTASVSYDYVALVPAQNSKFEFVEPFDGTDTELLTNWLMTDNDRGSNTIDTNDDGLGTITATGAYHNYTLATTDALEVTDQEFSFIAVVSELTEIASLGNGHYSGLNINNTDINPSNLTGLSTRDGDEINILVNGITVDATGISENALYGGYTFEFTFDDSSGDWSYTLNDADGDQISSNAGTTAEKLYWNQYIFLSNQSLNTAFVSYDYVALLPVLVSEQNSDFEFVEPFDGTDTELLTNWLKTDNGVGSSTFDTNDDGLGTVSSTSSLHNYTLATIDALDVTDQEFSFIVEVSELTSITLVGNGHYSGLNINNTDINPSNLTGLSTRDNDEINIQINGITVYATGISESALYGGYTFEFTYDNFGGSWNHIFWSFTLYNSDGELLSANSGTTDEKLDGEQYLFLSNQANATVSYDYVAIESGSQNSSSSAPLTAAAVKVTLVANDIPETKLLVYPNPASSQIILHTEPDIYREYLIRDINGRVVLKDVIESGNSRLEIDIEVLKTGIYLLNLNGIHDSKVMKIIKR